MRNIDLIRQVISASENNWPHVLGWQTTSNRLLKLFVIAKADGEA
ncbi:hypothetical protein [Escherichia coli]